jgi:hypothetical protein
MDFAVPYIFGYLETCMFGNIINCLMVFPVEERDKLLHDFQLRVAMGRRHFEPKPQISGIDEYNWLVK